MAAEAILQAWTDSGFDAKAVATVEPDAWSAGACSRGPVSGLDVLICEYASDEAARLGEEKMLSDWDEESIPTGAVVRTSRTLVAISDRTQSDRSGRVIARLGKLVRDQR